MQLNNIITLDSLYQKIRIFGLDRRSYSHSEMVARGFSYSVIDRKQLADIYQWCQEMFGDNWTWSSPAHIDHTSIFFINPEDQLMFNIRWGEHVQQPLDA